MDSNKFVDTGLTIRDIAEIATSPVEKRPNRLSVKGGIKESLALSVLSNITRTMIGKWPRIIRSKDRRFYVYSFSVQDGNDSVGSCTYAFMASEPIGSIPVLLFVLDANRSIATIPGEDGDEKYRIEHRDVCLYRKRRRYNPLNRRPTEDWLSSLSTAEWESFE